MKKTCFRLMVFLLVFFAVVPLYAILQDKLSVYEYEDTKQLVVLVENAASLIENKGDAAFKDFGEKNSKWLNDQYYLFVYDPSGKCIFHPIEPDLVGQDLINFKDIDKRPVITLISDVAKKPGADASGWVFYLWEEPWRAPIPHWKSSYIRKAIAPNGQVYLVGSGLYDMKMEKVFLQEQVDKAAELILAKGKEAAFRQLQDYACPFNIMGSYIMVTDSSGDIVADPSFPALRKKRNILNFRDMTGKYVSKDIRVGLTNKDRMWMLYIWPKGEGNRPARYLAYIRKVQVGNEVFYVASDYVPAMPIWMKR
ncbi:MAG: cache domain-containing protein [Candidatus Saganbacteria bacterium]|nr:cache domain-containing protein [Candidatus Saganbacteria bacterium]